MSFGGIRRELLKHSLSQEGIEAGNFKDKATSAAPSYTRARLQVQEGGLPPRLGNIRC